MSQLTITLFLLGYAIGQLIYGPLANFFGRKNAFYIGIIIATIGTIISIASEPLNSFTFLILGRLLEALGSSAGLVISFAIVNDHYFPEQARRIIAYMMLAFAVIPGIATLIGGLLVSNFHWLSCFYFLLVYGLLIALPVSRLHETALTLDKTALQINTIKQNYAVAFKNKKLRNTTFFLALTSMSVYVYAATVPFIAIHYLQVTPAHYGLIGLIPFIGTALGAMTSAQLSKKWPAKKLIKFGWIVETLATLFLVGLFCFNIVNLAWIIGSGFVFMFGGCLIVSNAASIATTAIEDKASASAVMNFMNVGMAVCGTFLLAFLPGSTVLKLSILFVGAVLLMSFLWKKIQSQL